MTPHEERRIYDEIGVLAKAARIAILTGLRQQEEFTLRREWIHLDEGYITLPDTKSGAYQIIHVNKEARALFREILDSHKSEWVFPHSRDLSKPVNGKSMYTHLFKPALQRLGLYTSKRQGINWHTLRKTFGSRLAMLGYNERIIMTAGRWSDTSVVSHYVAIWDTNVRHALEELSTIKARLTNDKTVDPHVDKRIDALQRVDSITRRGGRVAEGAGLENRSGASHRGFESHPLRQPVYRQIGLSPHCRNTPNKSAS